MQSFKAIRARAVKRHGGEAGFKAHMVKPKSAAALRKLSDDRWLAQMTRSVFQAGFVWKIIEAKWPGFEEAFDGFDPHRVAFYTGEDMGRLASGASAQYFLRFSGVDGFLLSPSVVAALVHANVIDKAPGSQKSMRAVQTAFNVWQKESGLSLTEISRTLALSIDG